MSEFYPLKKSNMDTLDEQRKEILGKDLYLKCIEKEGVSEEELIDRLEYLKASMIVKSNCKLQDIINLCELKEDNCLLQDHFLNYKASKESIMKEEYEECLIDDKDELNYRLFNKFLRSVIEGYEYSIKTKKCLLDWLCKQTKYYFLTLNDTERKLLIFYTVKGHIIFNKIKPKKNWPKNDIGVINSSFKKLYPDDKEEDIYKKVDILNDHINMIIENSPPLTCDVIVFRGTGTDYFSKDIINNVFTTKSLLSTSLQIEVALKEEFIGKNCCMNIIKLKKGFKCLVLLENYMESEILLPSKTKLLQTFLPQDVTYNNKKYKTFYWEIKK